MRTVDSFLMNYGKRARCQFKRLLIDEGLMLHTWLCEFWLNVLYAIACLWRHPTDSVHQQSNWFPVPCHTLQNWRSTKSKQEELSRCPADVTHFLNQRYEGHVMCTSLKRNQFPRKWLVGLRLSILCPSR